MALASAGKLLVKFPVRKKLAAVCVTDRVCRMLATPSAFAPASKVSATTLACVGIAFHTLPPSPVGTACGCAAGPAAAAAVAAAGVPPALMMVPAVSSTAAAHGSIRADLNGPVMVITTL